MNDEKQAWESDDKHNASIYASSASKHGFDVKTLGWGSRESQLRRFEVLAGIGDLQGKRILDVGCGLADFYEWLSERGTKVDYSGVDVTPEIVDMAREKFPKLQFYQGGILDFDVSSLGSYDYVFASGIFTHRRSAPGQFLFSAVERMYSLATRGVAFNSLSTWGDSSDPGEFNADPLETVASCRRISPRAVLRHDYMPHDFTVFLYRSPNSLS